MNLFKFLVLIRILAAGVISTLFGIQVDHVIIIGIDVLSVAFLFALFTFYVMIYFIRFYNLDANGLLIELDKSYTHGIQLGLLLFSILFSMFEIFTHSHTFDINFIFSVVVKNLFLVTPEVIFNFMIKIYNSLARRKNDEASKANSHSVEKEETKQTEEK